MFNCFRVSTYMTNLNHCFAKMVLRISNHSGVIEALFSTNLHRTKSDIRTLSSCILYFSLVYCLQSNDHRHHRRRQVCANPYSAILEPKATNQPTSTIITLKITTQQVRSNRMNSSKRHSLHAVHSVCRAWCM